MKTIATVEREEGGSGSDGCEEICQVGLKEDCR